VGNINLNQSARAASESPADDQTQRLQEVERWATRTDAELVTGGEFLVRKEREGLHVVGIVGFSGQWSEEKLAANPELRERVRFAKEELKEVIRDLQTKHGESLVISSGATMEGVPRLTYEICEELGVKAMGVACEKAKDYPLGKMRHLVIEGKNWGEESPTFLKTSDQIVMLGGGGQAKREAITAANEGKPVLVIQGFGGTADELRGDIVAALGRPDTIDDKIKEGRIRAVFIDCGRPIMRDGPSS